KVYTLGPLIHNPQVVEDLRQKGVYLAESIDDIDDGILVIRTHGVEPKVLEKAQEKGLNIIDATCPFVKNAHKYAKKLVETDYQTFIFGDRNHPEVKGIFGHTDNKGIIIESVEELQGIDLNENIGLVAQTTQSYEDYLEIISYLLPKAKELKIFNTICNTTGNRQKAAKELAKKVDVMYVIGGHNSANTKRLAEISANTDTPTFHIETVDEINWENIKNVNKIGITAGASTPDWIIKEVLEIMSEEKKEVEGKEQEELEEQVEEQVEEPTEEEVEQEAEEIVEEAKEEVEEEEAKEAAEESEEETEEAKETAEESEEEAEETVEPAAEAEEDEEAEESEEPTEETAEVEETAEEAEEESETKEFNYSDNDIADLKKGQKVTGTVVEINDDGVYVDVGYKTDGFIPKEELDHRKVNNPRDIVEEDEEIEVIILTLENEEGNMILSKKKADYEKAWERIIEAYEDDEIIEAEVTKEVKGGLVVDVGVRGFIPASHVAVGYVEDLSDYVGDTLRLKVIEVERDKNNVVLSAKKVIEEERAEKKVETLENLEEGDTVKGTVTKLVDFGAFIDLGGIEGLLHISEMSWGRIEHPSEVLDEGEEVEVKVLGVNKEDERISLGLKQLMPDPWEEFARKHYEGEKIEGKITKLVDFGAFMEVADGIEGLIHISQLSQKHVETPDEVVEAGETRKAEIINIDPEQRRIGLSLKGLEGKQEKEEKKEKKDKKKPEAEGKDGEGETSSGATIQELVGDIFDKEEE
ncbi:MAG TPA: bifunctional 4-hydroxy-3-methylbut-2-enyl diphosphate reductase/30S ribosomal protein S1, partial [Halanaerobiales bacterium]|nr:bifunctional 4-hydroxy-3-methylbut-2-enyl diphosphate reductase/30S ribosomal protein S1 [Halanaerobiales bacterium]